MDANKFQEQLSKLRGQLYSISWGMEVPKENLLHYTGVEGLCGILESRTLWAGHLGFMNDRTELEYGYELIEPIHNEQIEKHGRRCQDLLGLFPPEKFRVGKEFDVYAVCLTEARDDLAAWMTYGRTGRGYALEFDLSQIGKDLVMKVIYEEEEQRNLVETILETACAFIKDISEDQIEVDSDKQGWQFQRQFIVLLHGVLATFAPRFKHPKFQQECEWRFIGSQQKRPEKEKPEGFHISSDIAVPFLKFPLVEELQVPQGSPKRIWVGPNVDDFGVRSVKLLCSRFGHEKVEVKKSDIPLRAVK